MIPNWIRQKFDAFILGLYQEYCKTTIPPNRKLPYHLWKKQLQENVK